VTDEAAPRESASVLDPFERVSEVIFGVLMALTFTGSLSVATPGQDVHTMLFAAFGCNLAWGLTDAVMYLIGILTERHRNATLLRRLRATADPAAARRLIAQALPAQFAQGAPDEMLEGIRARLFALPVVAPRLHREDYLGALGVFVLVVLSTFPVVVPFLFFQEIGHAMRVSNALSILTMFIGGTILGKYAGGSPWRYGLAMTAIGAVLVAIIIALGG